METHRNEGRVQTLSNEAEVQTQRNDGNVQTYRIEGGGKWRIVVIIVGGRCDEVGMKKRVQDVTIIKMRVKLSTLE